MDDEKVSFSLLERNRKRATAAMRGKVDPEKVRAAVNAVRPPHKGKRLQAFETLVDLLLSEAAHPEAGSAVIFGWWHAMTPEQQRAIASTEAQRQLDGIAAEFGVDVLRDPPPEPSAIGAKRSTSEPPSD